MSETLLTTKITLPPSRKETVARPHLLDRLNIDLVREGGFARRLTLISAPAGYGKTTLAVTWLEQSKLPVAWISLDEQDNDPSLFMVYLLQAVRQKYADFGKNTQDVLRAPQPMPLPVSWAVLANDLASVPDRLVVVLDDYQVIHTLQIHQQLGFLIDHQPAQVHLVVITREDPLLPVPRLRARGQVLEIRQGDLRFNTLESEDFLKRIMGLPLTPDQVAVLEQLTEGWVTGLQLAALSMQGRHDLADFIQGFTGTSRFILDYVMEEVLARIDAGIQDFLFRTSILERLSGALCDAVVGKDGSQQVLDILDHDNLFVIPLDQSRAWYRYHHLFAGLLRHRLSLRKEINVADLHQRASQWYEENGFTSDAIQHAIAGQDWGRSTALIGKASSKMLKNGELVTLQGWRSKIPEAVVRSQPDLGLSFAWAYLLSGQFDEGEELLSHFETMAQASPPLLAQILVGQAYLARGRGDNDRLVQKSRLALELLPESDVNGRGTLYLNLGLGYWHEGRLGESISAFKEAQKLCAQAGNHYALLTAEIFLVRSLALEGRLRQAYALYHELLQTGSQAPLMALVHYDLSEINLEWNDLDIAGQHVEQGIGLSNTAGNIEFENSGHLLRARVLLARGDLAGALAEVDISRSQSRGLNQASQARILAFQAQLEMAAGNIDSAGHMLSQMPQDADAHSFHRFIGLVGPRLLLAQGRKAAARAALEGCLGKAQTSGCSYAIVRIRVLQALAAEKKEAAVFPLIEALKQAQPEGYVRSFLDAGPGLVPLLQAALLEDEVSDYAHKILEIQGQHFGDTFYAGADQVEALSVRELEVLRLLETGLSNEDIANRLVVSLGTVKTHLHHIYSKLGVTTRTQALAKAKKTGLLKRNQAA